MAETYQLTKEQEAELEPTRDKWIKIGLSCEPTNWKEAGRGIDMAYKADGHAPPLLKAQFRSPLEGAAAAAMLLKLNDVEDYESRVMEIVDKVLTKHGVTSVEDRKKAFKEIVAKAPFGYKDRVATDEEAQVKPSVRVPQRLVQYVVPLVVKKATRGKKGI